MKLRFILKRLPFMASGILAAALACQAGVLRVATFPVRHPVKVVKTVTYPVRHPVKAVF